MKNLVIIVGMILLGCVIFNMMTGPGGLRETAEHVLADSILELVEK